MKFNVLIIALICIVSSSCSQDKKEFTQEALTHSLLTIEGTETTLQSVIDANRGKTIVIDVWASWCGDCIKGLPLVKALQEQTKNDEVVYVFLSVDRKQESWKNAIEKRNIEGAHYFVPTGMKGAFGKAIDLDWIPRYMVVGKDGKLKLYRAIKANDSKILEAIKADR